MESFESSINHIIETSAAWHLLEEPKELASTAPRKRRAAESLDLEEPATLVPRFRLLLPEEVVTGAHGDEGLYEGV